MNSGEAERSTRFVELLTSHQNKLHAYISMLLLGHPGAQDVLQDANLQLWKHSDEFDFDRPFLPWACGFARQRVMAFRKTQSRSRLVFGDEVVNRIDPYCLQFASDADHRLSALHRCLEKLSPQQLQLVRERYDEQASVRTIAARTGDTSHNISSRLHRIRRLLATCIKAAVAAQVRP